MLPLLALALIAVTPLSAFSNDGAAQAGLSQNDRLIPNIEAVWKKHQVLEFDKNAPESSLTALKNLIATNIARHEERLDQNEKDKISRKAMPLLQHAQAKLGELPQTKKTFELVRFIVSTALIVDRKHILEQTPDANEIGPQNPLFLAKVVGTVVKMKTQGASFDQIRAKLLGTPDTPGLLSEEEKVHLGYAIKKGGNPLIAAVLGMQAEGDGGLDPQTTKAILAKLDDPKIMIRFQRYLFPTMSVEIQPDLSADLIERGRNKVDQISELNPAWHSTTHNPLYKKQSAEKTWSRFVQRLENSIAEQEELSSYSTKEAQKVLFFDEIDPSATSPKIKTEDAFGVDYKVKSGDEVEPGVLNSRLWMALGGKTAAVTFPGHTQNTILVLPKKIEDIVSEETIASWKKEGIEAPTDVVDAIEKTMLFSGWQYRIQNNIHSTGTLSKCDIGKESCQNPLLPKAVRKQLSKKKLKKLEGRTYIRLKRFSLELKHKKSLLRASGVGYSDTTAQESIVAKMSSLLHFWMGNRDAKDDNNRAFLFRYGKSTTVEAGYKPTSVDGRKEVFMVTSTDLGNSRGSFGMSGDVTNRRADWIQLLPTKTLHFTEGTLYVPKAWQKLKLTDVIEMGRMILTLHRDLLLTGKLNPKSDYGWMLAETGWPKFRQLAEAAKDVARAKHFVQQLEMLGIQVTDIFGQPISSSQIKDFSPSFALEQDMNIEELAQDLRISSSKMKKLTEGLAEEDLQLLSNGELVDSALMKALEKEVDPGGIFHRVSRIYDFLPSGTRKEFSVLDGLKEQPTNQQLNEQEKAEEAAKQ